jgi:hypothetical protein
MGLKQRVEALFLPRRRNNYRAGILDLPFLAFLVVTFILSQVSLNVFALVQPGVLGYASDITPEKIVEYTNQERAKLGLPLLKINQSLSQGAQLKAGDMFAFDYWAHESPSGREPWEFFREVDYDYRVAGENLARDFMNADDVVQAWMESPTHRDNIVNAKYKEIGVAVVNGTLEGIKTTLVVQFFGTPSSAQAAQAPDSNQQAQPAVPVRVADASVIKETEPNVQPLINPLGLTQKISTFVIGLVTGALLLDGYLFVRKKIYRTTGRTTAHLGFMGVVLILVLLGSQAGAIF